MFVHIKENYQYSLYQNKIAKKRLERILSNHEKKYSSLSFAPPRLSFTPWKEKNKPLAKLATKSLFS